MNSGLNKIQLYNIIAFVVSTFNLKHALINENFSGSTGWLTALLFLYIIIKSEVKNVRF